MVAKPKRGTKNTAMPSSTAPAAQVTRVRSSSRCWSSGISPPPCSGGGTGSGSAAATAG